MEIFFEMFLYTMPSRKYFRSRRSRPALSKRQVKSVKSLVNRTREKKIHGTVDTSVAVDQTGDVIDLCAVPQATTASTDLAREGDVISPYRLEARLNFRRSGTNGGDIIRIIFFKWKSDSTPVISDILGGASNTEHPLAQDTKGLYVMLSDNVLRLGNYDSSLNRLQFKKFFSQKKLGQTVRYNGGTTTGHNKIYMCIIGDRAGADVSNVDYNCRLHFTDA